MSIWRTAAVRKDSLWQAHSLILFQMEKSLSLARPLVCLIHSQCMVSLTARMWGMED